MFWQGRPVLVTGGASFIGSHIVDALVERGAQVRAVDNLSSGTVANIQEHVSARRVEWIEGDLLDADTMRRAVSGMSIVFHLAADHGGRGYVDLHQAGPASNLALDGMLFDGCYRANVDKIVFASSGCVYPNYLQQDTHEQLFLSEDKVGPPYDADNMYGWAKLMGEMTLKAFYRDRGMKSAACRYFTVYGERGHENHAVIAMIAKAFIRQDPFEVWGDGAQVRNWTYVGDIVDGTILAAEKIDDATAVNLGTMERVTVLDAVKLVMEYSGHRANLAFCADMPVGPLNRVADNFLAKKLLGWQPKMKFADGLRRTLEWYFATKDREEICRTLARRLTER